MKKIIITALAAAAVLSGCSGSGTDKKSEAGSGDSLSVYTTVYPLQDFTKKIGGKYVETESVYPPGTDEHSFDPSQKDIVKMASADLFFYMGYNLEGFVTKAKPILESEGVQMTAVGESVDLENPPSEHKHEDEEEDKHDHEGEHEDEDEHGHSHGDVDPHLWLDPEYANQMAQTIKAELNRMLPEHEQYFEENYQKLAEQFERLDKQFATAADSGKTKKIIVSHAAYGYWETRYGLEQISISGINASSEPSQKDLENIIKTAQANNLKYVLFEQNISSKQANIIRNEIGAEALTLHNLSVLTSNDIKAGEDYFSLMEKNIKTLKKALR